MAKRRAQSAARTAQVGQVVDLGAFRTRRRLAGYRRKIERVMESNREAISRLHNSGLLFTARGSRAGRDLLLAHQHMLRVEALIDRLADAAELPAPRSLTKVNAVYEELDTLLERTSELTVRTGNYLAKLRNE